MEIISGSIITKEKRHELFGNCSGGSLTLKPEDYQRKIIIDLSGHKCIKTNIRLNLRTFELVNLIHPNININGFDFSENFDGCQEFNNFKIYINLKCIVGKGGSQTRSLREVYWFIQGQLNYLNNNSNDNIYFANILDGDEANYNMPKFNYLLSLSIYDKIRKKIYIGELKNYFNWLNLINDL
jgi:hypothetical protein